MKCTKCGGEWTPPPGKFLDICPFCNENLKTASSGNIGETIRFGNFNWRVLEAQNGMALIITEEIIGIRPYDSEFTDEVWESCTLRQYLNGAFLDKFTAGEKRRIAPAKIRNSNNLWYGTWGGKDTDDMVFLLDLEEADRYFGDSGDYFGEKRKDFDFDDEKFFADENGGYFSNAHDIDRQAKYDGELAFWWLRSPGVLNSSASFVLPNGGVGVFGLDLYCILDVICGVRPALWITD
ncbi:MAG: DUF6273 domain-containing protein [Oscillospiraceae bacterium]|nr:DUF6273 domain-containing protein [Oscillospiraceae bacterium]